MLTSLYAEEKWKYSADVMEADKINNVKVQRLNNNVRFEKENKILLTDNAVQYVKDDVIYLNGNTKMINNMDTLTCDSMVYWSEIDSVYAIGNIRFVHGSKRGILGDAMEILYADTLVEKIRVINSAFAYNNLNLKISSNGPYLFFRDEMTSKEMEAHFDGEYISRFKLINMAVTSYHVVDDSLLAGNNVVSGDTILIDFREGNINRIRVLGGALGEFNPEGNNTQIDTTVLYGGEYIDYHIDEQLTFLSTGAYMEYQDTRLNAGRIIANWETNIMDAFLDNDEYPTVRTKGEAPMRGNNMVFDLVAKHGRIFKGRTSFDNGIYHGKEVFRDDPNVFHVNQSKYTSCDLDNPHFYLGSRKMKLLPKDQVVAKPLWLHIYDIPIIGLPIAVFPNKGGSRHSGWIMPSFDSYKSIGTGFRNFGYYWAPNEYMDEKILVNFFDEEGINISSYFKYKKSNGPKWYNFQYYGNLTGTLKRRLNDSDEIINLSNDQNVREDQRLTWIHNQRLDPTQRLAIKYEFVSNKDAYQNDQEVDLQNRLKQNLSSSFNYNKNWQTSSFSIGYNKYLDLSIENNTPSKQGRYHYRYIKGPILRFNMNTRKLFGSGDNWYNSITTSYTADYSYGRKDYYITRDSTSNLIFSEDLKEGGIKHSSNLNAPQTLFSWLTINPSLTLREDWIFNHKQYNVTNEVVNEVEIESFKRRFTWNSSLSANTKIYGLFPVNIGNLNAIRHIITPSIRYQYQPNFSDPKWGGDLYFQNGNVDQDYFKGSYVGRTSKSEKKSYTLSVNNDFQAKIRGENEKYKKSNFLSWSSYISYDALKDSLNFSEIASTIRIKYLSGSELLSIRMSHSLYQLDKDKHKTINKMLNIGGGEKPRLTRMYIATDMKINLFGSSIGNILQSSADDSIKDIEDEFYSTEKINQDKINEDHLWESKLQFRYSTNWTEGEKWNYKFTLKTINLISLSKNWTLSYIADFNIKDKEMTYHSFRIYRPLHCWEFSFNYWPRGNSAGFSLKINVRNLDLQDIKLTSKSSNRGFGGF